MNTFMLESEFSPKGDQQQAIDALTEGVNAGKQHQVLLGVTGSGKTFTMANVIAKGCSSRHHFRNWSKRTQSPGARS